MTDVANFAALLCTAAGVLVVLTARIAGVTLVAGIGLALDLWMAAGLLRLSNGPRWDSVAIAALLILVRKTAVAGLKRRPRVGPSPHA